MAFTVLYAVLTLFALVLVFGVTYWLKGWKIALLAAGIAFVLAAAGLVAIVALILRYM